MCKSGLDAVPKRRLSDLIVTAFFRACNAGDVVTADHLIKALESLMKRESQQVVADRRAAIDTLTTLRTHLMLTSTESFRRPLEAEGELKG